MDFSREMSRRLKELEAAGGLRRLAPLQGLSFSHNDYLGLAGHPRIVEAGREALDLYGSSSRGSRLLGGNSSVFEAAEERIAAWFGSPAALFFSCGYLANLAAVQALSAVAAHVVSDERNHASLIDGIRLGGREKTVIPHGRWDDVPAGLREKNLLLVAESLYGMDGDFADVPAIRRLWNDGRHFLLLDEAHAAGSFLDDGRGLHRAFPDWERLAVTVTFGKSFGVAGAAVLGSRTFIDWLLNVGRGFIFTTAPSPAVPAMVMESLAVLEDEPWRREELWSRAELVRGILRRANGPDGAGPAPKPGTPWGERSPVVAFHVPGNDNALRFSQTVGNSGLDVRAIRYPTVRKGSERIRISLNLTVSRDNTQAMAQEVVRQWMEFSSRESTRA